MLGLMMGLPGKIIAVVALVALLFFGATSWLNMRDARVRAEEQARIAIETAEVIRKAHEKFQADMAQVVSDQNERLNELEKERETIDQEMEDRKREVEGLEDRESSEILKQTVRILKQ